MSVKTQTASADSIVCFCYQQTAAALLAAYRKEGSVAGVQKLTRAGTACGGCRVMLESMFGQTPEEINEFGTGGIPGATACVKPGARVMKCFIAADDRLESTVFSSNAVPPQLIDCDSTIPIEYALLNSEGKAVLHRKEIIKTNQTFVFDTRREALPRPFYGMFLYLLGRSNYGASRFNVAWSNERSMTSTHENSSTGRPNVVLPILADDRFLAGVNEVYAAMQNPHGVPLQVFLRIFDVNTNAAVEHELTLAPGATRWLDVNRELYASALRQLPGATVAIRMYTAKLELDFAPTMYFFLHNRTTGIWSSNHL